MLKLVARAASTLHGVACRRSLCVSGSGSPQQQQQQPLELSTGLFGRLSVQSPQRRVEIASLDPAEHDNIGRVLVPAGAADLRAGCTGERQWLLEAKALPKEKRPLRVLVPIPMDLCVVCGSGCSVSVIENKSIELTSMAPTGGEFRLDRVKSGSVSLTGGAGPAHVTLSRTLIQSLTARAPHRVSLHAAMYQGADLTLECPNGEAAMEVGAVYCRRFSLSGARASIKCGSAHGQFEVDASDEGSVKMDSLEGDLRLRMLKGDVNLHLTRPRDVSIDLAEGDIRLGLQRVADEEPEGGSLLLDLTASGIDLDESLTHLSELIFPLGANSVRLVAQVPCARPVKPPVADSAAEDGANDEASSSSCTVRLLSGRIRLSLQAGSDIFAKLGIRED